MNNETFEVNKVCSSYEEVFKSDDFFRGLNIVLSKSTDLSINRTEDELDKYKESIINVFKKFKEGKNININDKKLISGLLDNKSVINSISSLLNFTLQISNKYGNIGNKKRKDWNNIIRELFILDNSDNNSNYIVDNKSDLLVFNIKEQLNILDLDIDGYICDCINNKKVIGNDKLSKILGVGEIRIFDNKFGILYGNKGIAKIAITSGKVLFNTGDLGIGDYSVQSNNNGIVIIRGEYGYASLDSQTGIVLNNTGDLNLGKSIGSYVKGKNIFEKGYVNYDSNKSKLLYNSGDLGMGKFIKDTTYDRIGSVLTFERGFVVLHQNLDDYNTGDLGIGNIEILDKDKGIILGDKGLAKIDLKVPEVKWTVKDLGIGKIENFLIIGDNKYMLKSETGKIMFDIDKGEIINLDNCSDYEKNFFEVNLN